MFTYLQYKKNRPLLSRGIAVVTLAAFLLSASGISYAQLAMPLPNPGTMLGLTPAFNPPLIKGLVIHPENPLQFDFLIDPGDADFKAQDKETEYRKLIKYFLAALTVPEKDLWVNLSPYEKDRIIPDNFGQTEMGRDLLAQDYILKQISASLLYPEEDLGKAFWSKVSKQAKEKFNTTDIPVNTFNKVWIVPDTASVYEKDNTVFLVDSHLKVMLEEDYVSMQKGGAKTAANGTTTLSTQIIREIILPAIEKEVNEGKNFANLRQINNALILALWYKIALKESLLGKIYADRSKVRGVDHEDPAVNQKIYEQYVDAFKKGVYNFIKEEYDPATQEVIPKKYFSGGYSTVKDGAMLAERIVKINPLNNTPDAAVLAQALENVKGLDKTAVSLTEPGEVKSGPASVQDRQGVTWAFLRQQGYDVKITRGSRQAPEVIEAVVYKDNKPLADSQVVIHIFPKQKLIDVEMFYPRFPDKSSAEYTEGQGRALLRHLIVRPEYAGFRIVSEASSAFLKSFVKMTELNPERDPSGSYLENTRSSVAFNALWGELAYEREDGLTANQRTTLDSALYTANMVGMIPLQPVVADPAPTPISGKDLVFDEKKLTLNGSELRPREAGVGSVFEFENNNSVIVIIPGRRYEEDHLSKLKTASELGIIPKIISHGVTSNGIFYLELEKIEGWQKGVFKPAPETKPARGESPEQRRIREDVIVPTAYSDGELQAAAVLLKTLVDSRIVVSPFHRENLVFVEQPSGAYKAYIRNAGTILQGSGSIGSVRQFYTNVLDAYPSRLLISQAMRLKREIAEPAAAPTDAAMLISIPQFDKRLDSFTTQSLSMQGYLERQSLLLTEGKDLLRELKGLLGHLDAVDHNNEVAIYNHLIEDGEKLLVALRGFAKKRPDLRANIKSVYEAYGAALGFSTLYFRTICVIDPRAARVNEILEGLVEEPKKVSARPSDLYDGFDNTKIERLRTDQHGDFIKVTLSSGFQPAVWHEIYYYKNQKRAVVSRNSKEIADVLQINTTDIHLDEQGHPQDIKIISGEIAHPGRPYEDYVDQGSVSLAQSDAVSFNAKKKELENNAMLLVKAMSLLQENLDLKVGEWGLIEPFSTQLVKLLMGPIASPLVSSSGDAAMLIRPEKVYNWESQPNTRIDILRYVAPGVAVAKFYAEDYEQEGLIRLSDLMSKINWLDEADFRDDPEDFDQAFGEALFALMPFRKEPNKPGIIKTNEGGDLFRFSSILMGKLVPEVRVVDQLSEFSEDVARDGRDTLDEIFIKFKYSTDEGQVVEKSGLMQLKEFYNHLFNTWMLTVEIAKAVQAKDEAQQQRLMGEARVSYLRFAGAAKEMKQDDVKANRWLLAATRRVQKHVSKGDPLRLKERDDSKNFLFLSLYEFYYPISLEHAALFVSPMRRVAQKVAEKYGLEVVEQQSQNKLTLGVHYKEENGQPVNSEENLRDLVEETLGFLTHYREGLEMGIDSAMLAQASALDQVVYGSYPAFERAATEGKIPVGTVAEVLMRGEKTKRIEIRFIRPQTATQPGIVFGRTTTEFPMSVQILSGDIQRVIVESGLQRKLESFLANFAASAEEIVRSNEEGKIVNLKRALRAVPGIELKKQLARTVAAVRGDYINESSLVNRIKKLSHKSSGARYIFVNPQGKVSGRLTILFEGNRAILSDIGVVDSDRGKDIETSLLEFFLSEVLRMEKGSAYVAPERKAIGFYTKYLDSRKIAYNLSEPVDINDLYRITILREDIEDAQARLSSAATDAAMLTETGLGVRAPVQTRRQLFKDEAIALLMKELLPDTLLPPLEPLIPLVQTLWKMKYGARANLTRNQALARLQESPSGALTDLLQARESRDTAWRFVDKLSPEIEADAAMPGEKDSLGGIDLNPANLNLQIKRDGNGIPLPLPMQDIPSININGFTPVIINITPVLNVPLLLGINTKEPQRQLSSVN